MAVDNASQIDAIANDKENACLVLLITDHLNWDNEFEHLKILQDKINRMKVTPDTEVDDAFDCGEVEGDTTKQRLLDRMSKGVELTTEYGTISLWTLCPEVKRVLLCMLIHLKTLSF